MPPSCRWGKPYKEVVDWTTKHHLPAIKNHLLFILRLKEEWSDKLLESVSYLVIKLGL